MSAKIKYMILGCIAGLILAAVVYIHIIPGCYEDSVLIGAGSFNGASGRWSSYTCGPAVDDFIK